MALNQSPIMLIGPHGVGKSAIVASIANEIGYTMLDIRLSQYSEGDILGIPYQTTEGTTRFYPPDIFKVAQDEPCVLFLDELNRASKEVRQAVFQLADSRRLGSLEVHESTIIVAACNPDDSSYQVHTLDPAELDRWFIFPFQPTVAEWIDWGLNNGIAEVILDYISSHPHDLDPNISFESVLNGPSRRSWTRFSNSMKAYKTSMKQDIGPDMVQFMAQGFLGQETGENFYYYFLEYQKQGLFSKILVGSVASVPVELAISLPSDIEINGMRESRNFVEQPIAIQNFSNFLGSVPKEIKEAVTKSMKHHCLPKFTNAVMAKV
jgi:replication-associated recombination protein RarA